MLLEIRFQLDQYINLRPVKLYPGVSCPLQDKGPEDIRFEVIRENTEDLYCGAGGFLRKNTPQEVATQEMITTRFGVERCLRWAFEHCRRRNDRKQLTLVHTTNVLSFAGDLWFRAFEEIGAADYPDIKRDYNHIDAACMWFVKNPEYYDTIVVSNMFGDIITDLGAMIQGGLGVAAGGNINPDPGGCSMFEPMGGSAPKYTGQDVINPIAAIAAMGMLLNLVGDQKNASNVVAAGNRIEEAIAKTTPKMESMSAGRMGYTTSEVGDLVSEALVRKERSSGTVPETPLPAHLQHGRTPHSRNHPPSSPAHPGVHSPHPRPYLHHHRSASGCPIVFQVREFPEEWLLQISWCIPRRLVAG